MFSNYKKIKLSSGFTLIELLIVIAILAILATVTLLVINPAQMIKQTRDSNRIAELNQINKALLIFQSFGGSSMGTHTKVYVSIPSAQADCSDLGLPALGGGYTYVCSNSTNYRKIDGTGWIPADLTSVQSSAGSLFFALPIDPINTVANGYYYTYIPGSWALSATMESDKYITANAATDGGSSSTRFEAGNEISLNANLDFCPTSVTYAGKTYTTVAIGTQCWFAQNLDNDDGCSSIEWVNSTDVGWCGYYTGGPFANEGLLYQWSAAMDGSTDAGAQGLCPTGWHIPTDAQWKILVEGQATAGCEVSTGAQCSPAGTHLSNYTLNHDNSSGFSGMLAGFRFNTGAINYRSTDGIIWSSTSSGGNAWSRHLYSTSAAVARGADSKAWAWSVRCLKD